MEEEDADAALEDAATADVDDASGVSMCDAVGSMRFLPLLVVLLVISTFKHCTSSSTLLISLICS